MWVTGISRLDILQVTDSDILPVHRSFPDLHLQMNDRIAWVASVVLVEELGMLGMIFHIHCKSLYVEILHLTRKRYDKLQTNIGSGESQLYNGRFGLWHGGIHIDDGFIDICE